MLNPKFLFEFATTEWRHRYSTTFMTILFVLSVILLNQQIWATDVGGYITTNTTWTKANSPYIVISDIIIRGATLTVEPGVVVKFSPGTGLQLGDTWYLGQTRTANGGLHAVGMESDSILFTSLSGSRNNWKGIYFHPSCDIGGKISTMRYCVVENAGQNGYGQSANIYCNDSGTQPTISSCTLRDATGYGIYLSSSSISIINCTINSNTSEGIHCEACAPTITGCTIRDNGSYPLHFQSGQLMIHTGNSYSGNETELIAMDGGIIKQNYTWFNDGGEPYAVLGNITLRDATLTVEPGVVVKFSTDTGLQMGDSWYQGGTKTADGNLYAIGTSSDSITFTSLSGKSNDWRGIFYHYYSDYWGRTSTMSYCVVEKAGQNSYGQSANVYCKSKTQPTISNCTLRDATGYGIYLSSSSISIINCTINSNTSEGIHCEACAPTITGCTIRDNGSYPLHFQSGQLMIHTGNSYSGNETELIAMDGGIIKQNYTWFNDGGEPYAVLGNITLRDATLTVEPGVVVKFSTDTGLQMGDSWYQGGTKTADGNLYAIGTSSDSITFTSLSGKSNDWRGIFYHYYSDYWGRTSTMSYCVVEKAGQNSYGQSANVYCKSKTQPTISNCTISKSGGNGIYLSNASPTISDCVISTNSGRGIYVLQGSSPEIIWSAITQNGYGITSEGGSPKVNYSDLFDNLQYDFENLSSQYIDATRNCWGSVTTTEMNAGGNPKNIAKIYDHFDNASLGTVDYANWLPVEPSIVLVSPNNAGNEGVANVTIRGRGFQPGASAKLTNSGYQDILGMESTVLSFTKVMTKFDLTGRQLGYWNVVVINPGDHTLTLPGGFTIGMGYVNLWVDIVGRNQIRVGREQTYWIRYGNSGNSDAFDIFLFVYIPANVDYNIDMPSLQLVEGIESWASILPGAQSNSEVIIPLWCYSIPAGSAYGFSLDLKIPFTATIDQVAIRTELRASHPTDFSRTGDFAYFNQSRFFSSTMMAVEDVIDTVIDLSLGSRGETLQRLGSQLVEVGKTQDKTDLKLEILSKINEELSNAANKKAEYLERVTHPITWKDWLDATWYWVWFILKQSTGYLGTLIDFGETVLEPTTPLAIVALVHRVEYIELEVERQAGFRTDRVSNRQEANVVRSWDPNEKAGASGYGVNHSIPSDDFLQYIVYFENVDSATASAEEVLIQDTLDVDLNWTTFALGEIQFGETILNPPPHSQAYSTTVILNDTTHVEITCSFEIATGKAEWYLKGIDPRDGYYMGFLPPNKNSPEGEGHVSFTVKPKSGLPSGTQILNHASITFDVNPPMMTNEVMNTIDASSPSSKVSGYQHLDIPQVKIEWTGEDELSGSGLKNFSVYMSKDGGPYTTWLRDTSATSGVFAAEEFHRYDFYSEARDSVGHKEPMPVEPDTTIWPMAFYEFSQPAWYLVSLPVQSNQDSVKDLFPSSIGAFGWDPVNWIYEEPREMNSEVGYWLAIPEEDTLIVSGDIVTDYTRHYLRGWHLIGSVDRPIDVTHPNDDPDGSVLIFFGWDPTTGLYYQTTTLNPKQGYWMAVMEECDFTLGGDVFSGNIRKTSKKAEDFFSEFGFEPPSPPDKYLFKDRFSDIPQTYELYQSYPNPFNAQTTIKYQLPKAGRVHLKIFNIMGQEVRTLIDENKLPGYYEVIWDGKDNRENMVASGVYIYKIQMGEFKKIKKMLHLK